MAPRFVDDELSPGDTGLSLLWTADAGAGACQDEEKPEAGADSGYSSGHSPSLSESSDSAAADPWAVRLVFPSVVFPSLSPWPIFNNWSPASEDDYLLQRSLCEVDGRVSSQSSSSVCSGSSSSVHSYSECDDYPEWGSFLSWEPVPTVKEAEVLQQIQDQEEAVIHARAALKRETKRRKYFEKVRQRRMMLNEMSE